MGLATIILLFCQKDTEVFLPLHSPLLDPSVADEQQQDEEPVNPSISHRVANAEAKFVARQLAEAAGLEEVKIKNPHINSSFKCQFSPSFQFFRPRPQRWLLRTKTLKEHPIPLNSNDGDGLQFAVKRVVSESELNSLLKNAWLGRK